MSNYKIALQKLMADFEYYAKKCLQIRTKSGGLALFRLNKAQLHIHEKLEEQLENTGKIRALILKGRQQGCSTYTEARLLWQSQFAIGKRVFILTHEAAATKNLFNIAKTYIEHLPDVLRPEVGADSANELTFTGLHGSYRVGTAGNRSVGRSETVQLFHGSEVAFWPHADDHAKGILQAVPDEKGTEIIMESTANGANGWFFEQCQAAIRGEGEYQLIFTPWFWQPEYRKAVPKEFNLSQVEIELKTQFNLDDEQIAFRRAKIVELGANGADGKLAFQQEYPMTVQEAFLQEDDRTMIPASLVIAARNSTLKEGYGKVIIGVDPARFGDDRTAIAVRKGRVLVQLTTHTKIDLMTLVGVIVRLNRRFKPAMINVDSCGLGAGVVDRLHELGFEHVNGVNAGGKAYDSQKYYNRRAEMWALLKRWLMDSPVKLLDRDDLLSDITAPRYSFDSNGRLKMEKKEEMKKRGLRSTDLSDAICLTLAEPIVEFADDEDLGWEPGDARVGL